MVIEYQRSKYGDKVLRPSIKKIAKIIRTDLDGTLLRDIERMNEYLERASPQIKFKTESGSSFTEVIDQLKNNDPQPVIVWINSVEPPDTSWHGVVVTGFDESNHVYYNDPWDNSRKSEEVGVFIRKMGAQTRMAKVFISKKGQEYISKWMNTEEQNENKEEEE